MKLVPLRMACQSLGMCPNTVRKYADAGLIKHVRNPAGQRLFDVESFVKDALPPATICYCRVSSPKQKDDLARQVVYMRQRFPDAEIVKDIGSGLNFKRKGLLSLLDRLARGAKLTVVVAHKDRLARFGVELIAHMLEQNGGELLVLDRAEHSPERELSDDLLAIIHVFSCRMHGLRRYASQIKEDPSLPH
jgi:predicted site-specific integrase-resolvase